MGFVTNYCLRLGLQALLVFLSRGRLLPPLGQWRFWVLLTYLLDLMSRHMLSYMPKTNPYWYNMGWLSYMRSNILFHLAVSSDSLRCAAYGTFCYGIS